MNNRELFLNDNSPVSIFTGGAGKGGTYTGLLKFKPYLEKGLSCAVVMRNKKDMFVGGGIFEYAKEIYLEQIANWTQQPTRINMSNGSSIKFVSADDLTGRKFDCLFIDNASQVDEEYSLNYFQRSARVCLWFNTNSTKNRGFIYEQVEPYLHKSCDNHVFDHVKSRLSNSDVKVYHGTCLDNQELLKEYPNYIKTLMSLSKKDRDKLLYGYY